MDVSYKMLLRHDKIRQQTAKDQQKQGRASQ